MMKKKNKNNNNKLIIIVVVVVRINEVNTSMALKALAEENETATTKR